MSAIPAPLALWLLYSFCASLVGWTASATSLLTPLSYWLFLAMFLFLVISVWTLKPFPRLLSYRLPPRKRFQRFLPLAFLFFCILVLLSGILYGPSNYDGLSYRVPRVLHWLAEGHWFWIDTMDQRMNTRSLLFEWLMAPLLSFNGGFRFLFFLNVISFLLLPGLLYGVFTALGVPRRSAYTWMWILPLAPLYLLQAGSIGNDSFATVYFLAGLWFVLRAVKSGSLLDWWLSCAAMAMLTSAKLSNLPLGLPWLALAIPFFMRFPRRIPLAALLALTTVSASFVPLALINYQRGGDWTGISYETAAVADASPPIALAGNALLLTAQNMQPPVLPGAKTAEIAFVRFFPLPHSVKEEIRQSFEGGLRSLGVGELAMEESAALGLPFIVLLALWCVLQIGRQKHHPHADRRAPPIPHRAWFACIGTWVSLLALLSQSSLITIGRTIGPYYPLLLFPFFFFTGDFHGFRRKLWNLGVMLFLGSSLLTLVLHPPRPLWPALTLLSSFSQPTSSHSLKRAFNVYDVYRARPTAFGPLCDILEQTRSEVVYFVSTGDEPIATLTCNTGVRKLQEILPNAAQELLLPPPGSVIVFSRLSLRHTTGKSVEEWLTDNPVEIIGSKSLKIKVQRGPEEWYVVRVLPSQPVN
jgi:hypothetical protein